MIECEKRGMIEFQTGKPIRNHRGLYEILY